MTTAGSVSKGCFVFKGKKKHANVDDYLPDMGSKTAHFCRDQFVQMWDKIDLQIQVMQADLNSNIFEDLLKFTQTCYEGFNVDDSSCISRNEIPAAALITGVNMPDHSTMFSNLVAMLHDRVTPQVAILKSKDCLNVKSILSTTLSQLLGHQYQDNGDDDEDTEVNCKKLPLTLSVLVNEYKKRYSNVTSSSSPKKRKMSSEQTVAMTTCPPVVIVMEDFENFIPKVVQDFILIASKYIHELPLVFVFGIATSVSTIHRLLPNHVSSLLCMEKFQAPASSEYLSLVINQVLMTADYPFKLGQGVFQLLLDIFLFHDFSVLNFNASLRFAMLDHYTNQKSSFLCCPVDEVKEVVMAMDENSLEEVRQIPSFMRYVEQCDVTEQPDLLLKEKFTKQRIIELIAGIHKYHADFFPMLRCLHSLVAKLPGYPLGKQVREVYSLSLHSNICDSDDYKQAINLLKIYSKDELKSALIQCKDGLTYEDLQNVSQRLDSFIHQIDNLDSIVEEETEEEQTAADTSLPSRASLHQLRQRLQDISKKQKKLTPYEKFRVEVIDYLDDIFRKYLACPMSLPLHEIFYYNSSKVLKHRLNAAPRSSLQMALSNPHCYLQCECCSSDSNQIKSTMPDTCIAYKLHLECGQLINLYDWMQAFIMVVSPDDTQESEEQINKLRARFIQAVSQLQFLGFVKPTKRKTDHVARLTWGGC